MTELLAVLGGAVVVYLIYSLVRFANFKSKLMNEFGRRGITFLVADIAYAESSDLINSMHVNGANVETIVDEVLSRYPELFVE